MITSRKRLLIVLLTLPLIASALMYCVFVVWFARYQDRGVGPSLTYAAYVLMAGSVALLADAVFWFALRRRASELRFLRNIAAFSVAVAIVLCWLGERFQYLGERLAGA